MRKHPVGIARENRFQCSLRTVLERAGQTDEIEPVADNFPRADVAPP